MALGLSGLVTPAFAGSGNQADTLLAQMTFDSAAALDTALASEARARARADFQNFPPFEGSVTHQAMAARKVFG